MDFLERARKVLPEFQTSGISEENVHKIRRKFFDKVESYNLDYPLILSDKTGFVNLIKSKNRKLFVWTVNETEDLRKCMQFGKIDGILSDNPVNCVKVRRNVSRGKFWISSFSSF